MKPSVPRDTLIFENRKIKRICVAPKISGCLKALEECYYNNGIWYIYITRSIIEEPIQVPDAYITGEKWITKKQIFYYAGKVEENISIEFKDKFLHIQEGKIKAHYSEILRNVG